MKRSNHLQVISSSRSRLNWRKTATWAFQGHWWTRFLQNVWSSQ